MNDIKLATIKAKIQRAEYKRQYNRAEDLKYGLAVLKTVLNSNEPIPEEIKKDILDKFGIEQVNNRYRTIINGKKVYSSFYRALYYSINGGI